MFATRYDAAKHHPSPGPAPATFTTRYDTLPYYYRPHRADEQPPLSLHDLTEDETSPPRPAASSAHTHRHQPQHHPAHDQAQAQGQEDDQDDDVLPKLVSPRRRVSFSTSSERSRSPDNRVRAGYLPPGSSLVAALGPKPRRPAAQMLPTPPLEESPPPALPPGEHQREDKTEERGGEAREEEKRGREEKVEEGHRRTRSRPTLLDLLSVPGPLRSPSPPPEKRAVEKQERMLPTPELTPTDEAPSARVADVVGGHVADAALVTEVRIHCCFINAGADAQLQVCEEEELPIASPMKESSVPLADESPKVSLSSRPWRTVGADGLV